MKNLWRKKTRSILTMLGITIGVASVIIISCIGTMGTKAVSNEFDSLGMSGITVSTAENSLTGLTNEELEIIKSTNGVNKATPVSIVTADVYDTKGAKESALVWGIDSTAKEVASLELLYGRFLTFEDVNSNASYCMVDQTFAQLMYGRDNVVGRVLTIACGNSSEDFTVVGVIKTGSGILQSAMGSYLPNFVYTPYTTIQQLSGSPNYSQIITAVDEAVGAEMVSNNIERRLNFYSGTTDEYTINNIAKQKEVLTNVLSIITLILAAVAAVALVVASLSIMTVMLVCVSERKREIGIKKSIGATGFIIMREFLMEALLLSVTGCVFGVLIGVGVSYIGFSVFGMNIDLSWQVISFTCLFSTATGVVFGVYPAWKASKLKPAETLRDL